MTSGDAAFEWNPVKAASNFGLHGVSLDERAEFDFETAVIEPDLRRLYGEARMIAIGLIRQRVHVLVYTERDTKIRVISLRKANDREVRRYVRITEAKGKDG